MSFPLAEYRGVPATSRSAAAVMAARSAADHGVGGSSRLDGSWRGGARLFVTVDDGVELVGDCLGSVAQWLGGERVGCGGGEVLASVVELGYVPVGVSQVGAAAAQRSTVRRIPSGIDAIVAAHAADAGSGVVFSTDAVDLRRLLTDYPRIKVEAP